MTCIVGIVTKDDVYIGGDSAGVAGLNITVRKDPKVFRNGPAVFGFTDSFRMGQLLRFNCEIPEKIEKMDPYDWVCNHLVPEFRHSLKEGGFAKVEDNVEHGGTFLLGAYGRLFEIDSDFQVGEPVDNYAAIGCGADFALGALAMTDDLAPMERIVDVLNVATKFSGGVRPPYRILKLNDSDFHYEWPPEPKKKK